MHKKSEEPEIPFEQLVTVYTLDEMLKHQTEELAEAMQEWADSCKGLHQAYLDLADAEMRLEESEIELANAQSKVAIEDGYDSHRMTDEDV